MRYARPLSRALLAVCLASVPVLSAGAAPGDLDALRDRAQTIADEVVGLESRLLEQETRARLLERKVELSTQRLGFLELDIQATTQAYEAALDRYVERAVEAYKSGPTTDVALLLSARDLNDVFTLSVASARAAESDEDALQGLLEAKQAAELAQARIDERKQSLLFDQARVAIVRSEIEDTLEVRRDTLDDLEKEIAILEAEARRLASYAADPSAALKELLEGTGPSRGIPEDFAGTGVVLEGTASWYGPGFEGNPTATGDIFDSDLYTAASKELELNSWLFVEHQDAGVVVLVNDRGPYVKDWILDLSRAAAEAIGITGIGWVRAEILIKI